MNPSPSTKVELIELISSVNWDNLLIPVRDGRNVVGQQLPTLIGCYMLCPFAHPVACCCMWLRVVGSCWAKFETGQTFEPTTPKISFLLWSPKRSATMFNRFAQLFQLCWGHACALHGLQSLMGYILPTMHCGSQHCWELLHPFSYIYTRFAPAAGLISTGILMNDRKKKLKTWEYNQTWNDG